MDGITLTAEAKSAMIANLELEMNARIEKLRAACEAQCASLRSRLERRVNRVPATKRHLPLASLLAPAATVTISKPAPTKAATAKKPSPPMVTANPTARKTRPPPASKPAATVAVAPRLRTAKRSAKRTSDELSSEDKENSLAVPKKRVRTAPQKPAPVATSKAPAARTTRATSRQKPAPAQILSPKNNNARQKPAKTNTRPR
ncbi:hypothetical protein CC86DRAFT_366919 [Ophiobolus disseminans]|uniref:Borealin N-terminal domain-containing protein n=1 Tax=Ophiobolus disseminans TaxID=1469910 RepID=A0A6A7AE41_9PLEO|nr:hypothetical protein CC86DRAFT_366919 [Ophiobolus disseminans]